MLTTITSIIFVYNARTVIIIHYLYLPSILLLLLLFVLYFFFFIKGDLGTMSIVLSI